jgi:hypothetical protein
MYLSFVIADYIMHALTGTWIWDTAPAFVYNWTEAKLCDSSTDEIYDRHPRRQIQHI